MSKKKLGIIVPIRDKKEELYKFAAHMQWFLADKLDYTIYFIEQQSPDFFNYGSLCNIGYHTHLLVNHNRYYYLFYRTTISRFF